MLRREPDDLDELERGGTPPADIMIVVMYPRTVPPIRDAVCVTDAMKSDLLVTNIDKAQGLERQCVISVLQIGTGGGTGFSASIHRSTVFGSRAQSFHAIIGNRSGAEAARNVDSWKPFLDKYVPVKPDEIGLSWAKAPNCTPSFGIVPQYCLLNKFLEGQADGAASEGGELF